jgi:citrate synthase
VSGRDGPDGYPTSLGTSDETTITLLGHDLASEIMGEVGFGELALWLMTQRRPGPGQVRVFEAVLASLADHGFVPTAIAARLTWLSAPDALQGAVAAGILGGGSRFLGVTEDCGTFLAATLDRHTGTDGDAADGREGAPDADHVGERDLSSYEGWTDERWDELAREVVAEERHAGRRIPGLGHPTHTADPRVPRLLEIAEQEGLRGPHLRLFEAIGRVHADVLGRRLPLNGAGVGGAALVDAGIPLPLLRGVALLARTAGVLGQLAEEQVRPVARDIYLAVHDGTRYVAPEG